jgi:hypothetical protein
LKDNREKKLRHWMKDKLTKKGMNPDNYHYIKVIPTSADKPKQLIVIHIHKSIPEEPIPVEE